jgi:hypothetical protein
VKHADGPVMPPDNASTSAMTSKPTWFPAEHWGCVEFT